MRGAFYNLLSYIGVQHLSFQLQTWKISSKLNKTFPWDTRMSVKSILSHFFMAIKQV